MEGLSFILMIVFFIYGFFIIWLVYGCFRQKKFNTESTIPHNNFSVVIPFRNEKDNLPILLKSLERLNYPKDKFEVILVNDYSEDGFEIGEYHLNIRLVENNRKSHSPKKDAIETAVEKANFDWIVTTDADCKFYPNWLRVLDDFIQKNTLAEMVCGQVLQDGKQTFLDNFQLLDFMGLQSATAGSFGIGKPFMCNGANFAYKKDFFKRLHAFENNKHIASGDDVFLLQKAVKEYPERVFYLRNQEHLVYTKPVKTWNDLFCQRVRWAAKSKSYRSDYGKVLAIVIFAGNLTFVISLVLMIFGNYFLTPFVWFKIFADIFLAQQTSGIHRIWPHHILFSAAIYPFFTVIVAFYSLFGNYNWKGRNYKM